MVLYHICLGVGEDGHQIVASQKNSGFLDKLERGDVILDDRGFTIEEDLALYGARLEVPSFTSGKKQLSMQEGEESKRLSKVRIHVECVIGLLSESRDL